MQTLNSFSRRSAKNYGKSFWKLWCFFRYNNVLYLSLKSQRFAQFLCHLMWSIWFNFLVNNLSVVKNLNRFYFSVPYALCREKDNDNTLIKNSYLPTLILMSNWPKHPNKHTRPQAHTHAHTHTHIYLYMYIYIHILHIHIYIVVYIYIHYIYCFGLNTVKDTFVLPKLNLLVTVTLHT